MGKHLKPVIKPLNPKFSSGPCNKRPGWAIKNLNLDSLGRSHRSVLALKKIKSAIEISKEILRLPKGYELGIVPGSDTGAMEIVLWSLLGKNKVEVLAWESFGKDWVKDIIDELNLKESKIHIVEYGHLPDLKVINFDNDVVFTWNGTTSGVCVPDGNWISQTRKGLTICDATSAVFSLDIPWEKIDVATYSWQKVLGGEGGHGVIILSPRAIERIENYVPKWPIPKLFRIKKGDKINKNIFSGSTINTPSMLCIEDLLDTLNWVKQIGGLPELINRTNRNFRIIEEWVTRTPWIDFLASESEYRSKTSVCLKIVDEWFLSLGVQSQSNFVSEIVSLLEDEHVAYDIHSYRDAPLGLRIWCGSTVETKDLTNLLPWLEWVFKEVKNN
ncbi:MAG: Phosphoserine aminotransferase [Alphaproteobacteria bacterium MarineAlpha2_Bin1]|nr:MAG: Phosphoserine aminotransferase [Alphaproteobacteria bacterium MarineAlpha2_Bin1]